MRLKLTIAYDGRPYNGWQSQACGNTVQDLIHTALAEVAKQPLRIHGSGRTDTGVHALAQIAHFDAPPEISMIHASSERTENLTARCRANGRITRSFG